jgi:hypothetical protein
LSQRITARSTTGVSRAAGRHLKFPWPMSENKAMVGSTTPTPGIKELRRLGFDIKKQPKLPAIVIH